MPILPTDHAELFYKHAGAGEPVLLLHGLGGSTADRAAQMQALAPHYRVLALDARGSGRSRDLGHAPRGQQCKHRGTGRHTRPRVCR
jgi:pimeloyl-ACP methyl ester carboxylesterase